MTLAPAKRLDLSLAPCEAARRLNKLPGCVFLDSSDLGANAPRLSIVAAEPTHIYRGNVHRDVSQLREIISAHAPKAPIDCGYPLGGLLGHVSYDGDYLFGEYNDLLVYHHHEACWHVAGTPSYLAQLTRPGKESLDLTLRPALDFQTEMSRQEFITIVEQAQEWIAAGDIYQVNLAHRFQAPRQANDAAFDRYERLRSISPAPYSAFLNIGGQQILSTSPECFLRMSGQSISTRPIKGTRPRFSDPLLDEQSAYDLITSEKEVSELVMITDLERNDLGQLCEYGSVEARDLLTLERFAQVFHLVSTVSGTLRSDIDHFEALRRCFPGGSITGAPKKRAREIIDFLEPRPRGLYTGAIGYIGWNGESQFNIAIRTLVGEQDHWHFHVGAGIVADSNPEAEYEETLHKAAGILKA